VFGPNISPETTLSFFTSRPVLTGVRGQVDRALNQKLFVRAPFDQMCWIDSVSRI